MSNRRQPSEFYNEMEKSKSKTELAKELGIKIPEDGYWGDMPSKVCGAVGGAIGGNEIKKAVGSFENKLK
jgi:hypothetical protein